MPQVPNREELVASVREQQQQNVETSIITVAPLKQSGEGERKEHQTGGEEVDKIEQSLEAGKLPSQVLVFR